MEVSDAAHATEFAAVATGPARPVEREHANARVALAPERVLVGPLCP